MDSHLCQNFEGGWLIELLKFSDQNIWGVVLDLKTTFKGLEIP